MDRRTGNDQPREDHCNSLCVQACGEDNITLDHARCLLGLRAQHRIADDRRRLAHVTEHHLQLLDAPHDDALLDVRQVRYLSKWLKKESVPIYLPSVAKICIILRSKILFIILQHLFAAIWLKKSVNTNSKAIHRSPFLAPIRTPPRRVQIWTLRGNRRQLSGHRVSSAVHRSLSQFRETSPLPTRQNNLITVMRGWRGFILIDSKTKWRFTCYITSKF